eukprot:3043204-Pyramimonas_sp.AAC.1
MSRAIWLCLPHCIPLLRPVLQMRSIDNRPFEVLSRWLQMADIHTPADIRSILSEGGEHPPGAHSPFGSQQIRLLVSTAGLKARLTEEEAVTTTRLAWKA